MPTKWIPYDPADPAWAPVKGTSRPSEDFRRTGTAPGDLVMVTQISMGAAYRWLPMIYMGGPAFPGATPVPYEWLPLVNDRCYKTKQAAQRVATQAYRAQRAYMAHRANLTNPFQSPSE